MKKTILILLAAFLFFGCKPDAPASASALMKDKLVIETKNGDKHTFEVELALSDLQIQKGLMGRTHLEPDQGMLFWFGGEESPKSFWMKNTLIPLDMVFIRKDGTIRYIHANAQPYDLTGISSGGPVAAVLEIPGGRAKELGIQPGDLVKQRFFK